MMQRMLEHPLFAQHPVTAQHPLIAQHLAHFNREIANRLFAQHLARFNRSTPESGVSDTYVDNSLPVKEK